MWSPVSWSRTFKLLIETEILKMVMLLNSFQWPEVLSIWDKERGRGEEKEWISCLFLICYHLPYSQFRWLSKQIFSGQFEQITNKLKWFLFSWSIWIAWMTEIIECNCHKFSHLDNKETCKMLKRQCVYMAWIYLLYHNLVFSTHFYVLF